MALNSQRRSRWLVRLHLMARLLGLTALMAAGVSLVVLRLWWGVDNLKQGYEQVRDLLTKPPPEGGVDQVAWWAVVVAGVCAALALAALLIETIVIGRMVAARRSAFGLNVGAQIALATALLVGVNMYSHIHYLRLDWTQDKQFTLADDIQKDLRQLKENKDETGDKGETTIVVYLVEQARGRFSGKKRATDGAAQRKVVEKVGDLVEQLREFGGQFKVVLLDENDEDFEDTFEELTKEADELGDAIERAEESSIFFHDRKSKKVQALSFNDFYLLDKTASAERKNLVLLDQGKRAFVNKVLNVDERQPKVGILVVHELLTTQGPEELGLSGVKKTLSGYGFDVQDVVLKKWNETGPPEGAVYTLDETKFVRIEEELDELEASIKTLEQDLKAINEHIKNWQTMPAKELEKTTLARQLNLRRVDDDIRNNVLKQLLEPNAERRRIALDQTKEERAALLKEKAGLNIEGLAERRRVTDLRAKLKRTLDEFDLIIIPRMTLRNVTAGDRIPNRVYQLEEAQVSALKDYLKSGKPILACLGPANEPPDRFEKPDLTGPDGLEDLLVKLGFRLPRQTVLYNVENRSFAERRSGLLVAGGNVEVPPTDFDWQTGPGPYRIREEVPELKPNPIRESMRVITRSVGKDPERRGKAREVKPADEGGAKPPSARKLDLVLRHPRPVYVDPQKEKLLEIDPIFLMTSSASWNSDNPFPSRDRTPRYESPKPDDPANGTPEEKRWGPFPIGAALETTVPMDWYEDKSASANPAQVRVAVIGHGGWFVATDLSPGKEKLLLNVCNWLMRRDELLASSGKSWEYPRVLLSKREKDIWHVGTQWVMPILFAWVGLMVVLVRRMR